MCSTGDPQLPCGVRGHRSEGRAAQLPGLAVVLGPTLFRERFIFLSLAAFLGCGQGNRDFLLSASLLLRLVPLVPQVDCQAGVGLVPGPGGGPVSAFRCHEALEASVAKHFPGNHLINCMGHSTENFYRSAPALMTISSVASLPKQYSSAHRAPWRC